MLRPTMMRRVDVREGERASNVGAAFGVVLAVLSLGGAGCGHNGPAPLLPLPASVALGTKRAAAREYLALLVAKRFREAAGWGNESIRRELNASHLGDAWDRSTGEAGRFVRLA